MGDALRLLGVWAVVFGVLTAALLFMTDGEPVCKVPLIVDVDDSSLIQCNTHVKGFEQHFWVLVLGTLIIASATRVGIVLIGARTNRPTSPTDRKQISIWVVARYIPRGHRHRRGYPEG